MAFICLLFYTFCIYIRPQEWILPFYGSGIMEISAIATLVLFIGQLLFERKGFVKSSQNVFIIMFLIAMTLAQLATLYLMGTLNVFMEFSKTILIYVLISNLINTKKNFQIYVQLLIVLTLILALYGIKQFYTGIGIGGQTMIQETRIRGISIFGDPNDLALGFVIVIPFLLVYIFNRYNIFVKLFYLCITGVILYATWLTNSRGGILSLGIVFAAYFYKKTKNIAGLIIGVAVFVLLIQVGPSRMNQLTVEEESAHGRIEGMANGIALLRSNILVGAGIGAFENKYGFTAHNSIMLVAGETGLLGLFCWIGIIFVAFKNLIETVKRIDALKQHTAFREFLIALQLSLIGFLVAAFFLSRAYNILLYVLVALSVAATSIINRHFDIKSETLSFRDIGWIGFIEVLALILIVAMVKLYN